MENLQLELEGEENMQLEKELLDVGPSTLPEVPTTEVPKPKKKAKQEEDDMAELAAWAS